jgi:hypothetical protein
LASWDTCRGDGFYPRAGIEHVSEDREHVGVTFGVTASVTFTARVTVGVDEVDVDVEESGRREAPPRARCGRRSPVPWIRPRDAAYEATPTWS